MKFLVNDNCIGCGLCEGICPEVFHLSETGRAEAAEGDVDPQIEDSAVSAKESCPVYAIESE